MKKTEGSSTEVVLKTIVQWRKIAKTIEGFGKDKIENSNKEQEQDERERMNVGDSEILSGKRRARVRARD